MPFFHFSLAVSVASVMMDHELSNAGQIIGSPKTAVLVDTPFSLKMHLKRCKACVPISCESFPVTIQRINDGCTMPVNSCDSKARSYSSRNTKLAVSLRPIGNPRKMFGKSGPAMGVVTVSSGYKSEVLRTTFDFGRLTTYCTTPIKISRGRKLGFEGALFLLTIICSHFL